MKVYGREVDVCVFVILMIYGEGLVMCIFDKGLMEFELCKFGMDEVIYCVFS